MVMVLYCTFSKSPGQEPNHHIFLCRIENTRYEGSYSSVEMQSAYSAAPEKAEFLGGLNLDIVAKFGTDNFVQQLEYQNSLLFDDLTFTE